MIVQVTRIPLSRCLASGCSFHDLPFYYRIGISTASKLVKVLYLVFGLSCAQNEFPNLQKSSGNWLLWSLKEELISRIAEGPSMEIYSSNQTGTQWLNVL